MIKNQELHDPNSCLSKALSEERIFVLLARDICAPEVIRKWVSERIRVGMNAADDMEIYDALACADAMEVERLPVRRLLGKFKGEK